jgi:alkylated DNA repair dioxygenase AlkB
MMDLFDQSEPEVLQVPDATLVLYRRMDIGVDYRQCFNELMAATPWREEEITLWGKRYMQPRLFAWYGEANTHYAYSGKQLTPQPFTPLLQGIRQRLARLCNSPFNSVLLNCYRHQKDSMGMHADDERELGERPVIASLSLGETRTLVMKHRWRKDLKALHLPLADGDLLIMRGDTQQHWKHGINKESVHCDARINLTFRQIMVAGS